MKLNIFRIIVTLSINIPFLLFNIQLIHAQTPFNNQEDLFYDLSPAPSSFPPENSPYTLGAEDVIKVTVFGLPEQGGIVRVFTDGTITLPLVGNVSVEGKTIPETNELLTNLYGRFLKRPIITVNIEQPRAINVAISGEVNVPGEYILSSSAVIQERAPSRIGETRATAQISTQPRVTDVFALAGGLTVSADVKQIKLKRRENNREVTYNLDFWKLLQEGDLRQNANLRDGDVIIVSKQDEFNPKEYKQLIDASFGIKYIRPPNVTVVGEVYRPGAYNVPIDTGPPRLTAVLQQSGGIRELADIRNIVVTRTTRDTEERIIEVDLWEMLQSGDVDKDIILRDGDTVTVPTAEELLPSESVALARANFAPAEILVNVVGQVVRPGPTPLQPNSSLNQAILAAGSFDDIRAKKGSAMLVRVNPNGTVTKRKIDVDLAAEVNEQTNPILKNNDVVVINRNALTAVGDTVGNILRPFASVFSFVRFFDIFRDRR